MEVVVLNNRFPSHPSLQLSDIAAFLHKHLDEYGDKLEDIQKAISYALADEVGKGGFVLVGIDDDQIAGAVVVNETGMSGYIPENILVYIAVHIRYRGKGVGKKLMEAAIKEANGDIALHVEPSNPARFLYEKLGFKAPYLEMRLKR